MFNYCPRERARAPRPGNARAAASPPGPGPGLPGGAGGLQERPCAATASARGPRTRSNDAGLAGLAARRRVWGRSCRLRSPFLLRFAVCGPPSGESASVIVPGRLSLRQRLLLERTVSAAPGTAAAAGTTRRRPRALLFPREGRTPHETRGAAPLRAVTLPRTTTQREGQGGYGGAGGKERPSGHLGHLRRAFPAKSVGPGDTAQRD